MKTPLFDSRMYCRLVNCLANDGMVTNAARVSTLGKDAADANRERDKGLINFLMKYRHGTPFEHCFFQWMIRVPIFVMRELHRHRIGISYNEESGRYKELEGIFYIPPRGRPLVQQGKPGHYTFVEGTQEQYDLMYGEQIEMATAAWQSYQRQLAAGICKEVARDILTLDIYSTCYVSCNPRSLMHFLSLRTNNPDSTFPSFPLHEIEILARIMESDFEEKMPFTYEAFCKNGYVCP